MPAAVLLALGAIGLPGAPASAQAGPPSLSLPVLCEIGRDCFVQQYVDAHPGPVAKDWLCGSLAYEGHDGLDIRLPTLADMERGLPVVAAAPGTVRAVRDGEPDLPVAERGAERLKGREAGNAVMLDHLDGWATQYSHLRKGSVRVRPGQRVGAGEILGLIGLSGFTDFPHLEFRVLRGDERIDPFTGLPPGSGCGKRGEPLWDEAAQQALVYRAGGLLAAGFAGSAPDPEAVKAGRLLGTTAISATAEALAFWIMDYGLEAGDAWRLEILGPDGQVFAESEGELERNQAQWIRFLGRSRGPRPWAAGRYRGRHQVARNGVILIDESRTLTVE